jgi:dihydrodipicolinate synthase/N-acetylneuraminate lyase
MGSAKRSFSGIFPSLPTVCNKDGSLDEKGQRSVVRFCIEKGASGLACLLFAGEFYKFSDKERSLVARVVVEETAGKVPVLVGISHSGTLPSVQLGRQAIKDGADGVILTPPYHANFVKEASSSTPRHYSSIAEALDVPIMIQDYEPATGGGVRLSADDLDSIARRSASVRYVKVEGGDHLSRMREIVSLMGERMVIFGGMGGRSILEEMKIGSRGSIPGAEMADRLVAVYQAASAGDLRKAREEHAKVSPYLEFLAAHFDSFVAVEKHVLKARGVIENATVRDPAIPIEKETVQELRVLIRKMGLYE